MSKEELIKGIEYATNAMNELTKGLDEYLNGTENVESNEETEMTYIEAYNKGLEDVWKFLKAFCGMTVGKRQEVFGEYVIDRLLNKSPQKVLENLEAYEKEKEIKVGDVVEDIHTGKLYVVTMLSGNICYVLFSDGSAGTVSRNELKKTNKHIDITSVLEQIRGE